MGAMLTRQPSASSRRARSSTDLCSIADTTACRRSGGVCVAMPAIARLLDSVAPLVNTISRGVAPTSVATSRRARSTASCARQPQAWLADAGLPNTSVK
jgi:hypothetical protein